MQLPAPLAATRWTRAGFSRPPHKIDLGAQPSHLAGIGIGIGKRQSWRGRSSRRRMASGHVNRTIRPNTWPQPTKALYVQNVLANREPSTHGTFAK
jgi:hypothetical protein